MASERPTTETCPAECPGCPDPPPDGSSTETPFEGWALAMVAASVFLGPLVMALLGALVAAETPGLQFSGATAGLLLGMVMIRLLVRAPAESDGRSK